jgi:tetratricopeptide (TPR) repeat protein
MSFVYQADFKRSRMNDPEGAITDYYLALKCPDAPVARCMQQIGVCRKMQGRYYEAIDALMVALAEAEDDLMSGKIHRDLADVYTKMGNHKKAQHVLDVSLQLLDARLYPEEHAMTLSWIGRNEFAQGHNRPALAQFEQAAVILRKGGNRDYELYNLLDYAEAASDLEQPLRSRRQSSRALYLTFTGRAGAGPHKLRALALFVLGCRGAQLGWWYQQRKQPNKNHN